MGPRAYKWLLCCILLGGFTTCAFLVFCVRHEFLHSFGAIAQSTGPDEARLAGAVDSALLREGPADNATQGGIDRRGLSEGCCGQGADGCVAAIEGR